MLSSFSQLVTKLILGGCCGAEALPKLPLLWQLDLSTKRRARYGSPGNSSATHPQSQRMVLDILTGQRFSRREASVNPYPKITFFQWSLCFWLGLLWISIVVSHFPFQFLLPLFSMWVDPRSKWQWRELNNTVMDRVIQNSCCLLQVLSCVSKIPYLGYVSRSWPQ